MAEGTATAVDTAAQLRKDMGHRNKLPAAGADLNVATGIGIYDDGEVNKTPYISKRRIEASWTKTKIFLGNIEPEEATKPRRRLRNAGAFYDHLHAFSREHVKKGRSNLLRYEGCP